MKSDRRSSVPFVAATVGFCAGVFGTALVADTSSWRTFSITELAPAPVLSPMAALPRTEMTLAMLEARSILESNRPWAAWNLLRDFIGDPAEADASIVLLAARAAEGWGGWDQARELLEGRSWLDEANGGEGWYLLGRAQEEMGDDEAAAISYRSYIPLASGRNRGFAEARLAQIYRDTDRPAAAATAFSSAASRLPEISDWLTALSLEALAETDGRRVIEAARGATGGSAPARLRRILAEVEARLAVGDSAGAIQRLETQAHTLSGAGAKLEAAKLSLRRAELMLETGQASEARELLRTIAWEGSLAASVREAAADQLGELTRRTANEELARASAFQAAGKPGVAARALRAAIDAGVPNAAGIQLRMARLLYDERDYGPAAVAFRRAASMLQDRETKAETKLYAARSIYRNGDRSEALADMREVVSDFEGTAAAGSALFLLADAASTVEAAIPLYRRAATIDHSPHARMALYRYGDRLLGEGQKSDALEVWETYVQRYPKGEETAEIAYKTARMHEAAGREDRARAMYRAATAAEPISYYAIQAADHSGIDPLHQALEEPQPWIGLASDATDAAAVLDRLALLEQAGLSEARSEEAEAAKRKFADRPAALVTLAEGLRDSGHPVDGIYLGYDLLEMRDGVLDRRVLELIFPLLYRNLIEREADNRDVDPWFLAGLVRQESAFRATAESWVGATGLGQIMPATGRWLAPSVGVEAYEQRLLQVPEINLRMAAYYIGEQLDRFEAQDLALAAYNAGPSRAARWRTQYDRDEDIDRFREQIPFDETREYVKIVLRNAFVYERLYGD